ncbi:MAG: hypothetical protein AAF628_38250 [Planctomycetota bacterium]
MKLDRSRLSAALAAALVASASSGQDVTGVDVAGPRLVHGAYFYVDVETRATLRLNNTDFLPDRVTVRLRLGGSLVVELGTVVVPASAHLDIPLGPGSGSGVGGRWGDGSRPGSVWGSIEIETRSSWGWIESSAPDKSLVMGSEVGIMDPAMQLQSLWWKPTAATHVTFVVQNTSDESVQVRMESLHGGAWRAEAPVTLAPHQARLLTLPDAQATAGAVRWTASNDRHVLQAMTLMVDEGAGFSEHFMARPPRPGGHTLLHSAGVPVGPGDASLGFPVGPAFEPVLLLANPSEAVADVEVDLVDTAGARRTSTTRLDAGEVRILDLGGISERPAHVGLSLRSSTGGLVAEALSVSRNAPTPYQYSFYAPFEAPPGVAVPAPTERSQPGVKWVEFDLAEERNTLVILRNLSEDQQSARILFDYERSPEMGDYVATVTLAPYATRLVDIEKLRQSQLPDELGRMFAASADTGFVLVKCDHGDVQVAMPIFDPVRGTCVDGCGRPSQTTYWRDPRSGLRWCRSN